MFLKINNILLTGALLIAGLTSCSSCASKPPPPVEPVPAPTVTTPQVDAAPSDAAPTTVSVTGTNWELTLPSAGWEVEQECRPEGCATIMMNDEKKNVMIMINKPFTGSYEEYTLEAIRSAKENGATVVSTKQLEINGHNFVLLEGSKDNVRVWLWFTLLKEKGYELSCGGLDSAEQHDLCFGVASTLKIN